MTSSVAGRRLPGVPTVVPTLDGRFRRYKIVHDGRVVACFNPATDPTASFLLRRPSLHPLYTPRGLPVTEQGAHNYPHHKGVYLALVITSYRAGGPDLYGIQLPEGELVRLTASGDVSPWSAYGPQWTHPHPSFAPDGRAVLYTADRTGHPQVYLVWLEDPPAS